MFGTEIINAAADLQPTLLFQGPFHGPKHNSPQHKEGYIEDDVYSQQEGTAPQAHPHSPDGGAPLSHPEYNQGVLFTITGFILMIHFELSKILEAKF